MDIQLCSMSAVLPIIIQRVFNFQIDKYFFYVYYPTYLLMIFTAKVLLTNF
ncbi:MAG: hypothetical protein AB9856_05615 [Cellulosilyticaceae bacterium]